MRRAPIALGVAILYLMAATVVLANAYSLRTFKFSLNVAGFPGSTDFCLLSGIETGPSNTGVATSYFHNSNACQAADQRALPSGYLAVSVRGYKDGLACATTGYIYSNVNTHYWQIWSNLCANPSGNQAFRTLAWMLGYDGNPNGNYTFSTSLWSPNQTY